MRSLALPRDADWAFEVEIPADTTPLDPAAVLEWRFGDPAGNGLPKFVGVTSQDGRLVTWHEKVPSVRAVLATNPNEARLHYVLGDVDLLWAVWKVRHV